MDFGAKFRELFSDWYFITLLALIVINILAIICGILPI